MQVRWIHDFPDDPVLIYTEIDSDLWEYRKVEIFLDGHKGFADKKEEAGGSILGLEPWPSLSKLASEPEFKIQEISQQEFEDIWSKRKE